jgi:hypothetical protein
MADSAFLTTCVLFARYEADVAFEGPHYNEGTGCSTFAHPCEVVADEPVRLLPGQGLNLGEAGLIWQSGGGGETPVVIDSVSLGRLLPNLPFGGLRLGGGDTALTVAFEGGRTVAIDGDPTPLTGRLPRADYDPDLGGSDPTVSAWLDDLAGQFPGSDLALRLWNRSSETLYNPGSSDLDFDCFPDEIADQLGRFGRPGTLFRAAVYAWRRTTG